MIPIPAKLAAAGVSDMVRVTDARMSGTSFGTVFLHVAPEAAVGGPLALVRDGDPIAVDAAAGSLDLDVPAGGAVPAPRPPGRRRSRRTCVAGPPCTAITYCRPRGLRPRLPPGAHTGTPPVRRASVGTVLTSERTDKGKGESREAMDTGGGRGRGGPARRRLWQQRRQQRLGLDVEPGHAHHLAQLRHRAERDGAAEPGQGLREAAPERHRQRGQPAGQTTTSRCSRRPRSPRPAPTSR